MEHSSPAPDVFDLFIIGGGINGCGIARDAAGRGLRVGLAEMDDLASATSSASTKLFHGGLRYLEYFEVRLVREALKERETLLRAMPHISWPMRFILPYNREMRFDAETPVSRILRYVMPWMRGRRPAWLIRLGLYLYDNLGGREILSGTTRVDLRSDPAGEVLQSQFERAFEYSDCWVEDARLVVLNARDAAKRGARIMTRTKVVQARRVDGNWEITVENVLTGEKSVYRARMLVNAAGPWVESILHSTVAVSSPEKVRLVRGSHIVTHRLFDHEKCYFFQGTDGRIIFAIPYETDFTLIGTTDAEHLDIAEKPVCTDDEAEYLCDFASQYFETPVTMSDIVWRYSGVRPLYDDGASSATAATRDYVLTVEADGPPLLNVFGGKITTYRRLAESALEKIGEHMSVDKAAWTAGVALPGGDFPVDGVEDLIAALQERLPFLDTFTTRRLVRAYGTEAAGVFGDVTDVTNVADLGASFGAGLYEREVSWLMEQEFAISAQDVVWRRSKLGLRMSGEQIAMLDMWMKAKRDRAAEPVV